MPEITITVNALSGDTGFDVNPTTVLDRASDGQTTTTFQNNQSNQTLNFSLEGTSDHAVLANASAITSVTVIITFAAGGKGAAQFTANLTDGESEPSVLQADNMTNGTATQTATEGTTYAPGGGITATELNAMKISLVGTGGAVNVMSVVKASVNYTAGAYSTSHNLVTMSSGQIAMTQGIITI